MYTHDEVGRRGKRPQGGGCVRQTRSRLANYDVGIRLGRLVITTRNNERILDGGHPVGEKMTNVFPNCVPYTDVTVFV